MSDPVEDVARALALIGGVSLEAVTNGNARAAYFRRAEKLIAAHIASLAKNGMVVVPREPTEAMIDAAEPAMEGVNNLLNVAYVHGFHLKWTDDKPPLHHAYVAMIAASQGEGEI